MRQIHKIYKTLLMNRLVHREYLAHKLVYSGKDLLNNPMEDEQTIQIPAFTSIDGKLIDAKVHKIITDRQSLVGYALEILDPQGLPRIEIVWRGTHNLASAHMDLEQDGAGAQSYNENQTMIMAQINAIVKNVANKTGSKVKIGISGHSLGGALAQRCATDLMLALTQNELEISAAAARSPATAELLTDLKKQHATWKIPAAHRQDLNLNNIAKLELSVFNSTGVDQATYTKAQLCSQYLQDPQFRSKNQNHKFTIHADYCLNARDGVQQTGITNILAECPFATVNLFKFDPANDFFKKALISSGVALLTLPFGIGGSILTSLATYKTLCTKESHTTKHSSFDKNGENSLELHTENFAIYSNKTLNQRSLDPAGQAKLKQQLVQRKSLLLNNPVTELLKNGLYFLAKPIIGDIKVAQADQLLQNKLTKLASRAYA